MAGKQKGQSAAQIEAMSALRLAQVEEALLAGRSHSWCLEYFSQPPFETVTDDDGKETQRATGGWGIQPRQVQNYIARVESDWRKRSSSPEHRKDARERCLMLMRAALDSNTQGVPGALGAAVKAADLLNKIDGVYSPVEVKHSGQLEVGMVSTSERRKRMAELEAKRDAARGSGAH